MFNNSTIKCRIEQGLCFGTKNMPQVLVKGTQKIKHQEDLQTWPGGFLLPLAASPNFSSGKWVSKNLCKKQNSKNAKAARTLKLREIKQI